MVNRKISGKGQITDEEALKLLDDNEEELYKYLYWMRSPRRLSSVDSYTVTAFVVRYSSFR